MLCHRACAIPADASTPVVPAPPCLRRSRSSNHESRITNHESRPFRPSLVRGDSPRNAPLCYATVPARFQLTRQRQSCQRHRACVAPAVRITNHESRITAIPALPCAGGLPSQRPPMLCHRACAIPADASTPVVPAPPCLRRSRSSNHESRITNHGRSFCGGTPPATPPCVMPPCLRDSS